MGSVFGKQMDENLKKQQQFMLETQRLQLERQLQMQNIMRERMMAMQVARSRDILLFVGTFTALVVTGGSMGFVRTRNPLYFVPSMPLLFICAYLGDMGYGNKLKRIRADAESLLYSSPYMFYLPLGNIKVDEIERRRNMEADDDQLKPNNLFL